MQGGLRSLIIRNLGVQTIAEAVALGCGLTSAAVLARYLDVEGFGAFNYAFAFMYVFLSLNDLGVNTIVLREIAREPERAGELIGAAIGLRLTIAAVVLAAAWTAIWLWPMDPSLRVPLSLFALILPLNALNMAGTYLQASLRFERNAVAMIIWRVSGLALILLVVALGLGVTAVLGALVMADVIGLAAVTGVARPLVRFRMHVDRAIWRMLLRSAAPVGASLMLTALVNRIDFFMLERMISLEAVGLYSAAYRITSLLEKFPLLVMATLFPVMSRLASGDPARLYQVYRKSVAHFAAVALPAAAVIAAFAPDLCALAFGEDYRAAGAPLRYLVWATVCLYLALTGGNLLISVGRARDNFAALGVAAAANVGLNLLLIPSRGAEGAAMATAISFAIILVVTAAAVERHFRAAPAVA